MKKIYVFAALATICFTSCSKKVVETAAYDNIPTECISSEYDGCQRLKVWASGKTKKDAIREGEKRAVYETTFFGITNGRVSNAYPVIDQPTARTIHQKYFDKFFSDNGAYKKFVKKSNCSKKDRKKLQGKDEEVWGVVVTVDRGKLKKHFQKDNIIE